MLSNSYEEACAHTHTHTHAHAHTHVNAYNPTRRPTPWVFDFERPFHSLPSGWVCKVCGAAKKEFESLDGDDGEQVGPQGYMTATRVGHAYYGYTQTFL